MSEAAAVAPRARSLDVVTAVWGAEYCRLFLDVCVPNQLTPGNLGALPAGSRYRVFTSGDDADALKASSALRQVGELMPVDVVVVRELSGSSRNKFNREASCHRRAVAEAREPGAALIFVCPDHVMSEGALAAVVRRHAAGSRAVVCTGLRVDREAFLSALYARGGAGGVPPRELVALALDHLHPFTLAHMIDSDHAVRRPIGLYWKVPGEGLLARCFFLTPLMVDPLRRDILPSGTIDGHYVRQACPIRDDVHVVSDSDELVLFEMSHIDALVPGDALRHVSPWRTAAVMSRCDSHQQSYWTEPIRLHVRDIGEAWSDPEAHAARFAGRVVTRHKVWRWLTLREPKIVWRDSEVRQQLRRAAKRSSAWRNRSAALLTHAAVRHVQQFRKRATRAGRRALRRARAVMFLITESVARQR